MLFLFVNSLFFNFLLVLFLIFDAQTILKAGFVLPFPREFVLRVLLPFGEGHLRFAKYLSNFLIINYYWHNSAYENSQLHID